MKKIFFSILAMAAMAACATDEPIALNQEAIGFNAFVDNAVRAAVGTATDPSLTSLTEFKLWGAVDATDNTAVSLYANDTVKGSTVGENSLWECTTKTQYWISGAKYNFAAVVNAGTVTTGTNQLPATITYTANGTTDLLYARSKPYVGQANENENVAFSFHHLLSKVKFTLQNTTSDATNVGVYTYTLTDVKITNAITEGTYTVGDVAVVEDGVTTGYTVKGTWAATETNGQVFDSIEGVTNNTTAECASEKLLVPITSATVSANVNLYFGGKLITTTRLNATVAELKAGYAYNLKVVVGLNKPIQFSVVELKDWENGNTAPADGEKVEYPLN